VRSARAVTLGTYPSSSAFARIFAPSSGETRPLPDNAFDTVAADTPRALAIAVMFEPGRMGAIEAL
jgi:hypothetical protein